VVTINSGFRGSDYTTTITYRRRKSLISRGTAVVGRHHHPSTIVVPFAVGLHVQWHITIIIWSVASYKARLMKFLLKSVLRTDAPKRVRQTQYYYNHTNTAYNIIRMRARDNIKWNDRLVIGVRLNNNISNVLAKLPDIAFVKILFAVNLISFI